ncbi:MAG: hypothetical protein ACLP6E_13940 [Acidimicrobiales bacterium]
MPDLDEQIRELVTGVEPVTAAEVIAAHKSSPSNSSARYRRPRRMRSYAMGAAAMAAAICVLVAVLVYGVSSSKQTVITPTRPAGVPASWQKVTFGGLTMYAPGNWGVGSERSWGDCGLTFQPLFKDNSVELDTGAYAVVYHCPSIPATNSLPPVSGLLVDPGTYGPLSNVSGFAKRLHINGLLIDPASTSYGGILVLAVTIPGVTRPVAVEIGLAGGGKVAHTIMYSMRASGARPTVPPTTPTTTKSSNGPWPARAITTTGNAQDIVPTQEAVYWLSIGGPQVGTTAIMVMPIRYDPATGAVENGPGISSDIGSSDLAVAGGSVWVAVGSGPDVEVIRLNPTTLAIRDQVSLPVPVIIGGDGVPEVYPVVAATTNGPLWVAGGDNLWALNPTTGAIETKFDAGNEIASLSTDPAGSLLYAGGEINASGEWSIKEYDAQTGRELVHSSGEAVGPPAVAATTGGVWVSQRSGMAGGAVELSANTLQPIAPPASKRQGFGTFDAIGGVGSSVSEGTLWLTKVSQAADLVCADPRTGAIRASELTTLGPFAPVASGHSLYALTSPVGNVNDVVVITPPAKCFG